MVNKPQLRKRITEVVNHLTNTDKHEQSQAVIKKLIEHPKYKEAKSLSIYLSTNNEINTIPILRYALEVDEKQCFIPFVRKSTKIKDATETRMTMVELVSMRDYEELPLNQYGIKEPKDLISAYKGAECNPFDKNNLDVVIVPGVAFGRDGRRLGHGKGYYDEFLFDWVKRAPIVPYSIGLAFKEQIVDNPFAVDGHDFILDEVLTA